MRRPSPRPPAPGPRLRPAPTAGSLARAGVNHGNAPTRGDPHLPQRARRVLDWVVAVRRAGGRRHQEPQEQRRTSTRSASGTRLRIAMRIKRIKTTASSYRRRGVTGAQSSPEDQTIAAR